MSATFWYTGNQVYTPDSLGAINDPPPYSSSNPFPQNLDYSSLQGVSEFILTFKWQVNVNLHELEFH